MYIADSKGFYQPVYEFVLDNEKDKEVYINIVAKKWSNWFKNLH